MYTTTGYLMGRGFPSVWMMFSVTHTSSLIWFKSYFVGWELSVCSAIRFLIAAQFSSDGERDSPAAAAVKSISEPYVNPFVFLFLISALVTSCINICSF